MELPFYQNPYPYYFPRRYRNNYMNNDYSYNKKQTEKNYHEDDVEESPEVEHLDSLSKPFLEFFGIKLYFDDILLISLIFFLYSEGVKDQNLFLVLILLLLS